MALSAKLQLRQSQSLVMTPQLMQSIKLLQFTYLELERFVDEEIERNPLLERIDPQADAATDQLHKDQDGGAGEDWFESQSTGSAEAIAESLDTSLENVFPDDPGTRQQLGPDLTSQWKSASTGGGGSEGEGFDLEDIAAGKPSMRDHINEQIAFALASPADRLIAHELTDALDDAGYFRGDIPDIGRRLGCDATVVQTVLETCKRFDPPGLFARDLAECLALQLIRLDRYDPAMRMLVGNLDLLAKRDFQTLKRLTGVDDADLQDMVVEIRALDPRPGHAFIGGVADAIVADVSVKSAGDGSWTVELNPDTLPRVLVDQIYFAHVSQKTKKGADRDFLAECLQNANWLTRSLDQRAKTILKVASEIVRQQDGFLLHGVRQLRPLNLRNVADAIGMHESTVSRVTSNKYMLTPRGVFELRYFFTASIASSGGGDAHSSEAVRDRIRKLIGGEQSGDILSDDAIVDLLRKNGIDIARRTVAKYREGMNIPSSVQRRREKRSLMTAGR